jgi:hypothetical protein
MIDALRCSPYGACDRGFASAGVSVGANADVGALVDVYGYLFYRRVNCAKYSI